MKLPEIRRRKSKKTTKVEVQRISDSPTIIPSTEKLLKNQIPTSNSFSNLSSNQSSGKITAHTTICNSDDLNSLSPPESKHYFINDIKKKSTNSKYLKAVIKLLPTVIEKKGNKSKKQVKFRDEIAGELLVDLKEVESYKEFNLEGQIETDDSCCCNIQ